MNSTASLNVRANLSCNGDENVRRVMGSEPGPSYYTTSEQASIRQQLQAGNAVMRDAAQARGYKLHPLLAQKVEQRS